MLIEGKTMKRDIHKELTDRVITELEKGCAPWVRPWSIQGDHINRHTGNAYQGSNLLWLSIAQMLGGYQYAQWLTYNQAKKLGGHVKKGEHAAGLIVFYSPIVTKKTDDNGNEYTEAYKLLKYSSVFNVEQTTVTPIETELPHIDTIACGEEVLTASGADIRHGGNEAFYVPKNDYIQLPLRDQFADSAAYYATAFHELTHWTGHKTRCDRLADKNRFGDNAYAFEELVAELGSSFLCSHCRIDGDLRHAGYIGSWLKALRNDKNFIFKASAQASKAYDFITTQQSIEVAA